MVGISALIMGVAVAQAAVVVNMVSGTGNDLAATTFVFSNLNSTVAFSSGAMGTSANLAAGGSLSGAIGSLAVTLTATTVTNALDWSFDKATAYEFRDFNTGWGISTLNDGTAGAGNLQPGETFLLKFDTSNLTLDSGKNLIFSMSPNAAGTQFVVYERTGAASGATNVAFTSVANTYSFSVTVGGSNEYAIVVASGTANLLKGFQIEVVGTVTGTAKPTGLAGIPTDSGAVLSWNSDITGFLNYYTVYRSTVSGTNNYAAITNVTSTTYIDTGLINGTNYYYAVTAVSTNGGAPPESAFSDELVVTPIEKSTNTVLLMDYDANVPSSVALSNVNMVVVWTNQVGTGSTYPAETTTPGMLYPSAVLSPTGLPGIDFTETPSRLRLMGALQSDKVLNTTSNSSGFVVMVALRTKGDVVTGDQQDILGNTSTTTQGFGIRWTGDQFQTWLAGNINVSTAATTGDAVVVSFRYDARTFEATAWESAGGNSTTQTRLPIDYSLDTGVFNLGYTTSTNRQFRGQVYEVKIWGSTLDDATLEAQRNAMVAKWIGAGAGFDAWATQWVVDIGATTNDYDLDGLDNLYEYGLGGDPTNFAQAPAILPVLTKTGSGFNYIHVQRNNDPGLTYTVETTTDLVYIPFTNMGYTVSGTNVGVGVFDTVTNAIPTTGSELFIKLNIEN